MTMQERIEWVASRIMAALAGWLVAGLLLSMAPPVSAAILEKCQPDATAWQIVSDPQLQDKAKQQETKRCNAENAVLDSWTAKLQTIEDAREKLRNDSMAGKWDDFRQTLQSVRGELLDIESQARANPSVQGSSELQAQLGTALNYSFQNVGMPAPASLDDALAKIEEASKSPRTQSQAATLASTMLGHADDAGIQFAKGLAEAAGAKVNAEAEAARQQVAENKQDQLRGRTVSGYVGGFGERISQVYKPWLFMLLVVTFGGAWLGYKRRQNALVAAVAAGLSYLVPGVVMVLVLVFAPFIPQWFIILGTIAGTVAVYYTAGPVFNWLAMRAGYDTPTGRRLRTIGGMLVHLRTNAGGAQSTTPGGVASDMAAAQATHGSARWGNVDEIRQAGHLVAPGTSAGFALASVPEAPAGLDKRFRFTGHVVTVAPTGSGKGIGAVIPNLLDYQGSALVLDVKGENAAVTARARRQLGQAVYVVDPFGVNKGESHAFNLLDRLDLASAECISESSVLADCLVVPDSHAGDGKHFDESAKTLLQGLMLYVVGLVEPERRNLGELRRLLTAAPEAFEETLADMAADESAAYGIPARAANTVLGMAERERGSVLSTAKRHTAFLDDPRVAAALSRSDFNLAEIKSKPMTVYLVLPANKIKPNAGFVRGFIGSVIAAITATTQAPAHRVAFILDEFGQLGYMQQIEDAVSLLRGYGLSFWVFIQDLSQLNKVYPKWQTFLANSAKTFYGTDDYDTAKYVSDSLGQATIEYETHNEGRNSGSGVSGGGGSMNRGKSSGSAQQYTGRHLLTPDEVMRLGPERPIILVKGEYPYQLTRLNYLTDREYAGLADPNPYH